MLSYDYQMLMQYRTVQESGPTVDEDKNGLRMMEPITHYHIQSAFLVSPTSHDISSTNKPFAWIQKQNVLTVTRTVRQLLLLGTR